MIAGGSSRSGRETLRWPPRTQQIGGRDRRMWEEIIQLLIALPVAAALLLLVPRHAARAWAVWLLICLIAVSLQGIAQGVFNYYNPDRLYLLTKENDLEFQRDKAGEVAVVVVNNPAGGPRASRIGR